MSNIVSAEVNNLALVMETYNQIKIYRSASSTGIFSEISNSSNRPILNNQDTLYSFIDSDGLSSYFYRTSYFSSSTNQESQLSGVVPATVISNQLLENMQVVITISSDVKDTSGNSLKENSFYFTTTYSPMYSSVRKLRLEIGAFIGNIPDDVLNLALFEASLMANEINWVKGSSSDFFKFARREWVTCKAAEILLHNIIGNNGMISKKLDNLEVTYDRKAGMLLLDKVMDCLARWEREVISGGAAVQKPSFFVKGQWDPDAPHVGRMWEKGPFVHQNPGSNLRYKPRGSRRYIGGWFGNGTGFNRGPRGR